MVIFAIFGLFFGIRDILQKEDISASFATFFLFGVLDLVTLASLAVTQSHNILLALIYITNGFGIAFVLWYKNKFYWGKFETAITALILAIIIFWIFLGPKYVVVISSFAFLVAALPQLRHAYLMPSTLTVKASTFFVLVAIVSTVQGIVLGPWHELTYPLCSHIIHGFILCSWLVWKSKYFLKK